MLYLNLVLVILSTFLQHTTHPALSDPLPKHTTQIPLQKVHKASRSIHRKPLCNLENWRSTVTPDDAFIITRESNWSTSDYNPVATSTGHAFGLGQLTDENRQKYAKRLGVNPYTRNPCAQLTMMRWYEADRYGSSSRAVEWWQEHGWY